MAKDDRRTQKEVYRSTRRSDYNIEIDRAKSSGTYAGEDTNPYIEKVGFLGVDDLDKLRRRSIK